MQLQQQQQTQQHLAQGDARELAKAGAVALPKIRPDQMSLLSENASSKGSTKLPLSAGGTQTGHDSTLTNPSAQDAANAQDCAPEPAAATGAADAQMQMQVQVQQKEALGEWLCAQPLQAGNKRTLLNAAFDASQVVPHEKITKKVCVEGSSKGIFYAEGRCMQ